MRVRVRFAKLGKIRWTSHRDVARMWERAFRRVHLPLAYSEGFSPRPKVSFGLALPTGHESLAEYLDIELVDGALADDVDPTGMVAMLSAALPVGVDAVQATVIGRGEPSLQESVTSCTWQFSARRGVDPSASRVRPAAAGDPVGRAEVDELVGALLAADAAPISRTRKGVAVTEDVRPGIIGLEVLDGDLIEAELTTRPRGLRPSEVLAAMGGGLVEADVRRLHQWISRDGARWEPLGGPAAATSAPHADLRAP